MTNKISSPYSHILKEDKDNPDTQATTIYIGSKKELISISPLNYKKENKHFTHSVTSFISTYTIQIMSRVQSSHLSHLRRRSTSPPPPPTPQPLIFSSRNPSSIDLPPQSWLEMGISGHSLTFSFHLDNQEIIMDLQDPAYVAQIITEGMRLGIEACINHMNIPGTELPFYHPEQPGGGNTCSHDSIPT